MTMLADTQTTNHPESKLQFLEALRGLASLYVMIHHARWFLWEGYSNGFLVHPDSYNTWNKALVYLFSIFLYGHETVIFFFLLSGFVIHLRYSRNLIRNKPEFQFKDYFKRRLRRIYPPLVFAILLTLVLDSLGKWLSFPIYDPGTPFRIVNNEFSINSLFGNLLLVMNTYTPVWGTNFALWSLKYEWWFYMLFPIFFAVMKKSTAGATILVGILYVLSFYPELWPVKLLNDVFGYMLIWWLGVLLADIYTKRIKLQWLSLTPLSLLIPILIFMKPGYSQQLLDLFWALGFTGVLGTLFYLKESGYSLAFLDRLSGLGKFSYSLYITHTPILVLFSGFLLAKNGKLPSGFEYVFIGILVCSAFAYLIHFLIERPFLSKKQN